jgi:WD40 repeat protein
MLWGGRIAIRIRDAFAGSHWRACSPMLAPIVSSDETGSPLATQTTELASPDRTRTREPTWQKKPASPSLPDPHRVAGSQPRDPERYQILAEHGRGGLGRVSRAHDLDLGRDVAIKELLSRDPVAEVRFLREALITARLEHPGIVAVHEAGHWPDGTPFYAMKLVSGRPLRELIIGRATAEERIRLLHHVIAVADAIAYAHDRHIIHRDLKPANVIVGDFGETIVIDWGLAKDLTCADGSIDHSGPVRTTPGDGLTAVGSILGTPAYMAPEQLRGEPVDQRADVFAIGAMLWELCTLEKLSVVEPPLRHRTLRRAGIDEDLVTIITKSLDPDPGRRYPDAGGLAADLKAFKSGARIAARSYSPLAMLAHWIRRHRTLALSAAAAIVLAVAGTAVYVRNIAVERDRADTALARVEATSGDLAREHAALTLKHAQLLLATDPSAALDTLATYQGPDHDRVNQLRAEAIGRGVATVRAVPHTDNVVWAEGMPDGAIISLGVEGTIARTSPGQPRAVLARDATRWSAHAYAPARHVLAYFCGVADLCMLDVLHGVRLPVPPVFRGVDLAGVAFSPGGDQLALLSRGGILEVFDVAVLARAARRLQLATDHGVAVRFVDETRIIVEIAGGIQLARMTGELQTLRVPDGSLLDAGASGAAFATTRGQAVVLELDPLRVVTRQDLCHDRVTGLRFVPGKPVLAYACKDGTVGIWDPERGGLTHPIHLEGYADLLAVSAAGDYLLAATENGTLAALDLDSDLVTTYRGHEFRLTLIVPPTREYPFLLSGDERGGLRAWPLPQRFARVVANFHDQLQRAIFSERAAAVVATTTHPELATFSIAGGARTVRPHVDGAFRIVGGVNGSVFATYGFSDLVELWSSDTMSRTRLLDTHHGSVEHLEFVGDTEELITAGQDGRLVRWTAAGQPRPIARFDLPISTFAAAPATRSMVVGTVDGALWRATEDGRVLALKAGRANVTRMLTRPGASSIYVGYADGEVVVIDTRSWRHAVLLRAGEAIRDMAVTPDDRTLAVAANNGIIHVGTRGGDTWTEAGTTWVALTARARWIALTADGLLVANCTGGVLWLWSSVHRTWLCLPTGKADPSMVVVTPDNKAAAALDNDGRIIQVDLDAVRKALDSMQPTHTRRQSAP